MSHFNYHFNLENISAAHAVQIHSVMRKFAFDPLLKLMEGNLHCTGEVAGFCFLSTNYLDHQLQAKLYKGFD